MLEYYYFLISSVRLINPNARAMKIRIYGAIKSAEIILSGSKGLLVTASCMVDSTVTAKTTVKRYMKPNLLIPISRAFLNILLKSKADLMVP